ncbi:aminodeoxychorismate synthase component I [Flavobacteriaceae bacterium Ap0902]|nr:aminodeoxychorismate synthase component I [Flavobacteriaceae bacterium Ap0902]
MAKQWVEKLNQLGAAREPFFFLIDYANTKGEVYLIENLGGNNISFEFPNVYTNSPSLSENLGVKLASNRIDFKTYTKTFDTVMFHLNRGDSYLTNLTFATPIDLNVSLEQLYPLVSAKYKIKYKEDWICFSPETFIQVVHNQIATFPMKGTIDASTPNAAETLLNDVKEKAEHSTIVDLLRNDLSMVASNVRVKRLMYLEKIRTSQGDILQMSSEIVGNLEENWHSQIGNILDTLLPAGSICGAPKQKTLDIIAQAEDYDRGFYTGVAGYYDGETLDTCVLIRFIENTPNGLVYKSGGGITAMSDLRKEYEELNQKIYVPISRIH